MNAMILLAQGAMNMADSLATIVLLLIIMVRRCANRWVYQ